MKAIDVQNVCKTFKKGWFDSFSAVDDVSFHVRKGQIFGVLGPNGCGKSTMIRMMGCLLYPDSGSLSIQGNDVVKKSEQVRPVINRVSVEASFFKKLSAWENLVYAGRLYGLNADEIRTRVFEIAHALNLSENKINEQIERMSRGQQQKIAIIRGFMSEPEIVLLDEPTTGLDPSSKKDVQKYVTEYVRSRGATVILTSHDMNEVERLCDFAVMMHKGTIVASGTCDELKRTVQEGLVYELGVDDITGLLDILSELEGVHLAYEYDPNIRLHVDTPDEIIHPLIHVLDEQNRNFKFLREVVPTLEDVFLNLTGTKLEEEDETN